MKTLNILSILSLVVVLSSCGQSQEDKEALKELESTKITLEIELDNYEQGKKFWMDQFNNETDDDLKYEYSNKYLEESKMYKETQTKLSEVKARIADLQ